MKQMTLYRKRLIPDECICLKDDIILYQDKDILVTSWKTLRPKQDLDHGFSCYYLREDFKISKFYRSDHTLLCYYCDIISPAYEEQNAILTVTDLLADVIIYPDGFVKVVDLDELAYAFDRQLLPPSLLQKALLSLQRLLSQVYEHKLPMLLAPIDRYDPD